MRLPILAGPLRGRWWLPESRGKILRILTGRYEPRQTRRFRERLERGDTVLDVGAHAGFYTLLASMLVGPTGRVWSFEPDPRNAEFLRRHVGINGCANVRVEEAAVSDRSGSASFGGGSGSGTGRLTAGGDVEVRTITLDDYCAAHAIVPRAIKIDVEGAEAAVLRGALATLRSARPALFLSTHGPEPHAASLALVRDLAYAAEPILGERVESSSELLCLPRG